MDVVAMPQLGETVTEGTITTWTKQVGDRIEVDDALFEVSTEKVDTEVPAAVAGYLRAILVPEGETVPIGTAVAVITATDDEPVELEGVGGGAAPANAPPSTHEGAAVLGDGRVGTGTASSAAGDGAPGGSTATLPPPSPAGPGAVRSPVVRRLLAEHGLDPAEVAGSGREGRITRADVLAAAALARREADGRRHPNGGALPNGRADGHANGNGNGAARPNAATASAVATPAPTPPVDIGDDDRVVDLSRARLATAEHMVRSLATAAHALVAVEVDYAAVDAVRREAGLSYLPFVARAVVDAVREFPHVNASLDADRLVVRARVHLGIAVDVDQEALVVPVLRNADDLRLPALSAAVADLADRARRRRLPGDASTGGTFTLTNVGSYGTLVTAPIINQPQVAILSTDGVRMAPVAVRTDDGRPGTEKAWGVVVHPVGNLCLSFDHRAFDGAYAAAFLARVRDILQTRDWSQEVPR
ncbi:MAG TPA: dihydrolipoamide acetyltransferase family protein [Aquihabitans sp.]|nr:dihydrolipoamide acetyltransferase family protein [Aquihabitans sp.]